MYIPIEHEKIPLVIIDNFLPRDYIIKLYEDFIKLKPFFGIPHWSSYDGGGGAYSPDEPLSPLCTGQDLWLPFDKNQQEKNANLGFYISNLQKYLFHQGILDFLTYSKSEELNAYSKFSYTYKYHIINYGDGGYYNWHKDLRVNGMTWDGIEANNKANAFTLLLLNPFDLNALETVSNNSTILSASNSLFSEFNKVFPFSLLILIFEILSFNLEYVFANISALSSINFSNSL